MSVKLVRRQGLDVEKRRQLIESRRLWAPHRSLKLFLQDTMPAIWDEVRACRMTGFKESESREWPGYWKAEPVWSCHQIPWCLQCVKADSVRRTLTALNRFANCTPAGKQPRFIHLVQNAPIKYDGPEHTWPDDVGWGKEASHDLAGFRQVVMRAVEDHYGPGCGAIASYHDFGERAFAKRHPHIDLTLNGWAIRDGKPAALPRLDLTGRGYARWMESITAAASRFRIDAQPGPRSLDVSGVMVGAWSYYGVLKYQMRQIVDLRKIDYSRERREVRWISYKPPYPRQRFTVNDFLAGLLEYQVRLGAFGERDPQQLHAAMGHMAKGRPYRAANAIFQGDDIPHGKRCPCRTCGDWDTHYPDEVERALFRGFIPAA